MVGLLKFLIGCLVFLMTLALIGEYPVVGIFMTATVMSLIHFFFTY